MPGGRWTSARAGVLAAALAVISLGIDTGRASAAVTIGPQAITVSTPTAQAVITRVPFDISFQEGGGQPVLSEVPNTTRLPQPLIAADYPVPLGGRPEPENDLYAPLTYLVGTATTTQWPGGQLFFQGNEQGGEVSGIQYSAQDVIDATPSGEGVQLVLSTDDPTGRRILVSVEPGPSGTMQVLATPSPATGVALISDSFGSDGSEQFHGFGGRHNSIDQHGNDFYSWIEEENSSGVPGGQSIQDAAAGQPNYMFPNGPEAAYMAQALFYSSRPYGFMLDQPTFARWRMDSDDPGAWQVTAYGGQLDYLVAPGPAPSAIGRLTAITGRERVPPAWAIAPEIDRAMSTNNPQTPAQAAAQISSDLGEIRQHQLSVASYRPETWTLLDSSTQDAFVTELRHLHIHLMRYFRAFVASPSAGFEPEGDFDYAISHHLVATLPNGSPAIFQSPYQNGQAALIDFSNPAAVAWWQSRIRQALDQGADGFMQDFGEQVDSDWHFADGETGATMHNRYPILYDQATRQVIDQYEQEHPGRRIFFFTRAGYSGDPGSTAYENAEFLGDNTTSWDHASGLASVIPDELNRSVGGAYGPTTDIGGYLDALSPPTTKELFLRWAELAALTPFYRVHNSGATGSEMPWNFDPETIQGYKTMAQLHTAAEPLILSLWRQADQTGMPVMRPLWLADPDDPTAAAQDEEWLLGPDVLVAPVVTQGATSRSVYFPAGCWTDPATGARYSGPAAVTVAAPLQTLPYFFACGTQPFTLAKRGAQTGRRSHNPTDRCPVASGHLTPRGLGALKLGMTRTRARRTLPWSSKRARRDMDFFCLARIGIRAGYPSPRLLRTLSPKRRRHTRGRIVLILTSNPSYALRGVRPGSTLRVAVGRLRPGRPLRVGLNTWYLCRDGAGRGILKVRHHTVEEIGIASPLLTRNRTSTRAFLTSFR